MRYLSRSFAVRMSAAVSSKLLLLIALLCFCLTGLSLSAQTAHFNFYATEPVGGLNSPAGVAVDSADTIYIADWGNSRIIKAALAPDGSRVQSTIGSGINHPVAVAVDKNGNVYICDNGNNRVLKETLLSDGSYSQSVVETNLSYPFDVQVDSNGAVYIADFYHDRVLKETPNGSGYSVSTVGSGLHGPIKVYAAQNGDVYISDFYNSRVVKETYSGGSYSQSTVATGISAPYSIALDDNGNVYICEHNNSRVLKETRQGDGSYVQSQYLSGFDLPTTILFDQYKNFYIADQGNNRVLKYQINAVNLGSVNVSSNGGDNSLGFIFDSPGTLGGVSLGSQGAANSDFVLGSGGTCTAGYAYLAGDYCTVQLHFSPTAPGQRKGAVSLITQSGVTFLTVPLSGTGVSPLASYSPATVTKPIRSLNSPQGVAVDAVGNLYIADTGNGRIVKSTLSGGAYTSTEVATSLLTPSGVALDGSGSLYIAETDNNRVLRILPGGSSASPLFTGLNKPAAVAVDVYNNVYIADTGNGRVLKKTLAGGSFTETVIASGLGAPTGIAVDGSGNVFIADNTSNTLLKSSPTAGGGYNLATIASGLNGPVGVAVDPAGNLFVSTSRDLQISQFTPTASGYNQTLLTSETTRPAGIAADGLGNVYITDTVSDSVLKASTSSPQPQLFGNNEFGTSSQINTILLSNRGNQSLSFPVPTTGENPGVSSTAFVLNKDVFESCPTVSSSASSGASLPAGSSCKLALSFIPSTVGSYSETLSITNNTLGASPAVTQTATLSASSSPGHVTINVNSPTTSYGSATISLHATISYSGNVAPTGAVTFAVGNNSPVAASCSGNLSQKDCTLDFATSSLAAGSYPITVNVASDTNYVQNTGFGTLTIAKATPVVTWAPPASISYGTALSATQLSATANVTGSFTYIPAAGSIPNAGTQNLSVTFTPDDSANYVPVTVTTPLIVNKATPAITWSTPAAITYGSALSSLQLNATANAAGSFSYSPAAGVVLGAGSHTLEVTFTPTDATDFNTQTASITLIVERAAPIVSWPSPAPISYGTPLSAAQLNATANMSGTFSYSPASGTVLNAGAQNLSVTFTPSDTTNYTPLTTTTPFTVNKATPAINWSAPSSITYGAALNSQQLNATSDTPGTFTYAPAAGTVLSAGSHTLQVTLTPSDTTNFSPQTASVTLSVEKASTSITWAPPASISYGTPLGAGQLNATANIPGTFTYTPSAGALLNGGAQILQAVFTPTDSNNYAPSAVSVALAIMPATTTITLNANATSIAAGGSVTLTSTIASTAATPEGTVTFYDGGNSLGTANIQNGQATYIASGLASGNHALSAIYNGNANYLAASSRAVALAVTAQEFNVSAPSTSAATQTVTAGSAANFSFQIAPSSGSFSDAVTFTVFGLPTGATYTLSPSSLPAGSTGCAVTLTVQTAKTTANTDGSWSGKLAFALLLLPLFASAKLRRTGKKLKATTFLLLCLLCVSSVFGISGCGGSTEKGSASSGSNGSGSSTSAAGSSAYVIMVVATSGSVQHATTFTLKVQ